MNVFLSENETALRILVGIALTFLLCRFVLFCFNRLEKSRWNRKNENTLLFRFLSKVSIFVLVLLLFFYSVYVLSGTARSITTILAGSGVITVIIGLAAQESLGNIISGFFIMLFKPFVIGDRVILKGSNITGYIEGITLRHTIVRTYFNSRYVIPNSKMNSEIIENSSLIDERSGMYLDVTVEMDADVEKAIRIMEKTIEENPSVLDLRTKEEREREKPISYVFVRNISLYGVELRSNIWSENVDTSFEVLSELRKEIIINFKKEGIRLAQFSFPADTESAGR